MLYERDYKILTKEEKAAWIKVEAWIDSKKGEHGLLSSDYISKYWDALPPAVVFHKTLFPNNYLDPDEHNDTDRTQRILKSFESLLDKKASERDIVKFIKQEKAYFIIRNGVFPRVAPGHHASYLFKEVELHPDHIADYLLIGKDSGGYEFVFVELEDAHKHITTKSGDFGVTVRKGLKQVEEWSTWVDAHFSHLKGMFDKHKKPDELLPDEFFELDKSRVHFVVIAGRRSDYNEKTYRLTRKKKKEEIHILHYDHLIDGVKAKRDQILKAKRKEARSKLRI